MKVYGITEYTKFSLKFYIKLANVIILEKTFVFRKLGERNVLQILRIVNIFSEKRPFPRKVERSFSFPLLYSSIANKSATYVLLLYNVHIHIYWRASVHGFTDQTGNGKTRAGHSLIYSRFAIRSPLNFFPWIADAHAFIFWTSIFAPPSAARRSTSGSLSEKVLNHSSLSWKDWLGIVGFYDFSLFSKLKKHIKQ